MKPRIAIIAALPREIASLVRGWQEESDPAKKIFVYTNDSAVVVCAGMGAARAEIAVQAALARGSISYLFSVGWAGALKSEFSAGSIHHPAYVMDAATNQKFTTVAGTGTLVTVAKVANAQEKRALAAEFDAEYVDMEAATVARLAAENKIPFAVVKTISDECEDAPQEILQAFTTDDGWIREKAFALHVALRPWMWLATMRMARTASASARNLCQELHRILLAYQTHGTNENG